MLPPISSSVFEQNPKFKALYSDLNASRLTPDGSTKLLKKQRAQDELKKKLQAARIEIAKTEIVLTPLEKLGLKNSELPAELRQVVQIICTQLDGSLAAEDREVLIEDFEHFVEHIEDVAKALSDHIVQDAQEVASVLGAIDNPAQAPSVTTLPNKTTALRNTISTQSSTIATKTIQLADLAASISVVNRELLQSAVRILEQLMHGSVSRAMRAKAEHLATVARGMELKLAIITHAANPSNPEATAADVDLKRALEAYAAHLRRTRNDLAAQERNAETRLKDYEGAGKGMQDIAKRYAELTTEMEEVKEEIARLKEAD